MTSKISRLMTHGLSEEKSWNNIVLSSETVAHRKQLKQGMDDFASFNWRGVDAFDVFGAFIINNKNTLKFYNGPTFSNEYTKPQFESAAGQLVGVSFGIQKIDFTIGVYWISEEDYRKLIDWLNPYEINTLTFGFEPEYYYLVKLASIGDAIRYIVGSETIEKTVNGTTILEKVYQYYTEIKLTFEVQGDPCAYRKIAYEWEGTSETDNNFLHTTFTYKYTLKDITDNHFDSHLPMPFKYKMHLNLAGIGNRYYFEDMVPLTQGMYIRDGLYFQSNGSYFNQIDISELAIIYRNTTTSTEIPVYISTDGWSNSKYRIIDVIDYPTEGWNTFQQTYLTAVEIHDLHLEAYFNYNTFTNRLFYIDLKNLSIEDLKEEDDANLPGYYLDIIYDSATGLLYWDRGDSQLYLLSRLSTASTGSRLVDGLVSFPYKILGKFENWNFDLMQAEIEVQVSTSTNMQDPQLQDPNNFYIDMRARTNLI